MTTIDEAIKTIEKEMPNYKVYGCKENKTFFFFDMQPKRLWGTNEIPYGGSAHVVWKETGEFDMIDFDLWDKEKYKELVLNDKPKRIEIKRAK